MAKSRERLQARELRRNGESIREIARQVSIARSTVSLWCRDIVLTNDQLEALVERDKLGGARGRMIAAELAKKRKNERVSFNKNAGFERIGKISNRELFLIGIALYWAEGSKGVRSERFVFVNSDPKMIVMMIRWLRECMHISVDDIVCRVGINEAHQTRIVEVERHWSDITGIPLSQFKRASFKKVVNKKVYENFYEHYGTLDLLVKRCTKLFYEMLGSIKGLSVDRVIRVVK
ncbi:helix-turn-helix domain-containing protein [Candidatus Woesebacteria bacterium]|nr:helix-turn-helix domain-containing protein [Candidatus Woesebacteria bacterium]